MRLIGTLVGNGAYAVYATPDGPQTLPDLWDRDDVLVVNDWLLLPACVRLVEVDYEPAPEFLPPDLSPSLEDDDGLQR